MLLDKTIAICIPARYQSTRLPGKPLELIDGLPMIIRVLQNMSKSQFADRVIVLTDDVRIMDIVQQNGYAVEMTSSNHNSGTDRLIEYQSKEKYDYYFNVQGDEPMVNAKDIDTIISQTIMQSKDISTPITQITDSSEVFDYAVVKVVVNKYNDALYFSRQAIPAHRDLPYRDWFKNTIYYRHIGIYGFSEKVLQTISSLNPSKLEQIEKLEQLRWLEEGMTISCLPMSINNISVDTPEDLEKINAIFKKDST